MRLFLLLPFLLTACSTPMANPHIYGSGYTYHQDDYKSPPPPKAWNIGYEYSDAENAKVLERWNEVAINLLDKIEFEGRLEPQEVFLAPPKLDNAFTQSLDHAMRGELRNRGYTLLNLPGPESLIIATDFYDPEHKDVMRSFTLNGDLKEAERPEPPALAEKNLALTARALSGENILAQVENQYTLPLYGYQDRQLYFPISQNLAEIWR